MSKSAKTKSKAQRKNRKSARKSAMKAQYKAWADEGNNGKSKRSRLRIKGSKQRARMRLGRHKVEPHCVNTGCMK